MFLGVEYKDVLRHVAGQELTLGGLTNYREAYIARLSSSAKAYLPAGLASVIGAEAANARSNSHFPASRLRASMALPRELVPRYT
jgi:hypothetical protein